jgi:hypothetical protein
MLRQGFAGLRLLQAGIQKFDILSVREDYRTAGVINDY